MIIITKMKMMKMMMMLLMSMKIIITISPLRSQIIPAVCVEIARQSDGVRFRLNVRVSIESEEVSDLVLQQNVMGIFLFSPAWPFQDLLSVSQASIARLEEGRHSKPCRPETSAWSNSVSTNYKSNRCNLKVALSPNN